MTELVDMIEDVVFKFNLASKIGLKRITAELMNGETYYFLKDAKYGKTN